MATSLLIIRHAETALNASSVIQFPDTPLSTRGRWQAERLAARLGRSGVTHVVSSDYRRAHETAQRICDLTKAKLVLDQELRERNLGELRGRAYADVRDRVFAREFAPRTGESWPVFHQRIDMLWERIQRIGQTVDGVLALVTHGFVCQALATRHLTLTPHPKQLRFPNASVTIVGPEPPWPVQVLGCDTHLQ